MTQHKTEPANHDATAHLYEYEIYQDDPVGWSWIARHEGKVLVISTGHNSHLAAQVNLDCFRRNFR